MSASVYQLRPEPKFEMAQRMAAETISRVRALVTADGLEALGPDEIEQLATQFQLAAVNLRVAARGLRECEEERRRLAAWRQREELRFERVPEDDLSDLNDRSDGNVMPQRHEWKAVSFYTDECVRCGRRVTQGIHAAGVDAEICAGAKQPGTANGEPGTPEHAEA